MNLFLELDAWLSALVFAGLMAGAWWVGARVHAAWPPSPDAPTRVEDGALALFGLLLAFCFSGGADRYNSRKAHLLNDAIAIGDFATTASMLQDPERKELQRELLAYVEQRLVYGSTRLDDPGLPKIIADGRAAHGRMTALVARAVETKNTPSVHAPLMMGLNGVTKAHDERLYGARSQVPGSIVLMLIVLGVVTTFSMGRLRDRTVTTLSESTRVAAYIGLVALVFAVTIDLQQPRRGVIRVSHAPMEDLLASMKQPPK